MYQPHDVLWVVPCALFCGVTAAVCGVLQKKNKLKSRALPGLPVFAFFGCILVAIGTTTFDNYKLRAELRGIPPDKMLHVRLFKGQLSPEIGAADVSVLMSRLQSLKAVSAHHSYPTDPFEVAFIYSGRQYQYRIGRDSARPDEYWVDAADRKDDIGRIRSGDLGQIVQRLLADKP